MKMNGDLRRYHLHFLYVGAEFAIGSLIVSYLMQASLSFTRGLLIDLAAIYSRQ